ncbi:MAG TPA: Rnase Y domain-containing protein, partial [Candidatus Limnocylindrales bacterium]|nr:Rnase Y domain-containing protein [Candidatus Limnocylindrales bacterium]
MPFSTEVMIAAIAALIGGVIVGYLARRFVAASAVKHAEGYAERLVAEARAKQKELVLEGKDDALQAQRAAEEEARAQRADL